MSRREVFGIWHDIPVYRLILELLLNKPNGVSDRELINMIKKEHGISISKRELAQALIKLEINGFVKVEHSGSSLFVRLNNAKLK
ncbi:MAG: ArsR family transcriptional regulator [Desulfurococcaceae archaeon]